MIPEPAPWSLLTATAALLAFLVGLYTLVGRDRKSPYLINSVFQVFLLCLIGAAFDILSTIILPWRWSLAMTGAVFLFAAVLQTCSRIWTIYIRLAMFVDPGHWARLKLVPGVRQYREWRKRSTGPTYEHHPVLLAEEFQRKVRAILVGFGQDGKGGGLYDERGSSDPRSVALSLRHHGQANDLLSRLVAAFLMQDKYTVQYMTASRHPIEFLEHLKKAWPEIGVKEDGTKVAWEIARQDLVIVDAYTPHFGFLDTINQEKKKAVIEQIGGRLISSAETYAGMHSASSAAFKLIKRESLQPGVRQPTLVIYEDMFALADLESVEQYRVFVRHVLPSERLWDGMFTVFAETGQPVTEWKLISSYADIALDLSERRRSGSEGGNELLGDKA
jgi:hypothetical protein